VDTLVRFDPVYVTHFKCDKHRISDYLNLYGFLRDIYQMPGIAETVNFDHIRTHYYRSHKTINPTGIISIGPAGSNEPHGRDLRFANIFGRAAIAPENISPSFYSRLFLQ
jgi:putative glutathione S-transferase